MLAVSPLRSSNGDEREAEVGGFATTNNEFSDGLPGTALLEDINFDDLFMEFDEVDMLPDLEVDPAELLGDISIGGDEESAAPMLADASGGDEATVVPIEVERRDKKDGISQEEEVMSATTKGQQGFGTVAAVRSPTSEADKARKSSPKGTQQHGKRKVKVDWTPELHRRFVQAVEQLGVDKAVPSRILELMGIDCLTRHNIASHLQKYRSHRKHLLAREAEAASWSQRRQMYATAAGGGAKRDMNPWLAPTMGFPPPPPPPPIQPFRPLHVWGHPSIDHQPLAHAWPRPLVPAPRSPALPSWTPQPPLPPPPDLTYWHPHPQYQRGARDGWVPSAVTQGTPYFPQPMRFPAPPVAGILPHPLYRPLTAVPPSCKQPGLQVPLDAHPSEESKDAAIGDVLAKPWQPLPLGLKPPSMDSVLLELQRQGISKIPPTCS